MELSQNNISTSSHPYIDRILHDKPFSQHLANYWGTPIVCHTSTSGRPRTLVIASPTDLRRQSLGLVEMIGGFIVMGIPLDGIFHGKSMKILSICIKMDDGWGSPRDLGNLQIKIIGKRV